MNILLYSFKIKSILLHNLQIMDKYSFPLVFTAKLLVGMWAHSPRVLMGLIPNEAHTWTWVTIVDMGQQVFWRICPYPNPTPL